MNLIAFHSRRDSGNCPVQCAQWVLTYGKRSEESRMKSKTWTSHFKILPRRSQQRACSCQVGSGWLVPFWLVVVNLLIGNLVHFEAQAKALTHTTISPFWVGLWESISRSSFQNTLLHIQLNMMEDFPHYSFFSWVYLLHRRDGCPKLQMLPCYSTNYHFTVYS